MSRYTILLGGALTVTDRLRTQIDDSTIIAADSGIRHAEALNVCPQLWLGDFDSSDNALKERYNDVERLPFPIDKDATDGELAVDAARAGGADEIILCGAFGGERSDHALLHMTLATSLAAKGLSVFLTSGREEGYPLIPGDHAFNLPQDTLFSIIGFSDLEGLTIEGAKWSLQEAHIDFGSSWTLSNRVCGTLFISLHKGSGLLLATPNLR